MSVVKKRIEEQLPYMPQISQSADDVLQYLIERSGVLRAPSVDTVNFVHKTFQEYLAAKAAIDSDSIPMLIERATDDNWREVIILAPGHASPKDRKAPITGLIERGLSSERRRHRLHLIAASCLETAPVLDPDTRAEVDRRLNDLVPPRTLRNARGLAAVGPSAVPYLRGRKKLRADSAAATVRALASIGGDEAMEGLAEYANDARASVTRELFRGRRNFPLRKYTERVLANVKCDVLDVNDLDLVPYFE